MVLGFNNLDLCLWHKPFQIADIRNKEKWYLELKRSQRLERVPQDQTRFQENPTILEENQH